MSSDKTPTPTAHWRRFWLAFWWGIATCPGWLSERGRRDAWRIINGR
jgi:hypothetical protein